MKKNNIFISAGESSGDLLGADVARALLKINPALRLTGMGGQRMKDTGVDIQFNAEKLAVVGFIEVITHLCSILSAWSAIKKYLKNSKPDLVILIDFPDTHFRMMKAAKKLGIPVLYYVSPQIWAWRASRIKTIKKYVDHMAVLFSFEEKIYRDAKVPVTFVGHPLSHLVKTSMTKSDAYRFFNLNSEQPVIALFPGSRHSELKNHLPIIIESAKNIRVKNPDAQLVLVLADHFDAKNMRFLLPNTIKIVQNNLYDLLQITDAAIAVSGTVTLEIALMQVPLCIIYKMKPLSYWIAKLLIHVKYIGLCNIISEKLIAKEFIQDDTKPELITHEVFELLNNKDYREKMKLELSEIKNKISVTDQNSSEIVAKIALTLAR